MLILRTLVDEKAISPEASREMIDILLAQEHNDGIPAGLPPATRVAHKTGWITATWHDAALVYPAGDPRPYALVILSRGIPEEGRGKALQADIARMAHAAIQDGRARMPGRRP